MLGLGTLGPASAAAQAFEALPVPRAIAEGIPLPLVTVVIGGLFLCTLAISRFSLRIGAPATLGVLLFGLSINTDSELFNHNAIEWLHTLSLSMLLFYARLRTELRSIRGFLEYGLLLGVGGVIVSSLLLGLIVCFVSSPTADGIQLGFNQMPLAVGMLIATCLGSTDSKEAIRVLSKLPSPMPARLGALLEFESSVNDPTTIILFGVVVGLFTVHPGGGESVILGQLQLFLQKISSGLMIGVILGYLARFSLEKLVNQDEELLILGVAIALLSYGAAEMLGGSGFISAYVTGMFMSNHVYRNLRISPNRLLQAMLPFNTMTEITVFLIFGLAMDPSKPLASLPEGIAVALAMMVVARPLSVLVFQWCSPFSLKEALLLSWCGLRGAVPLALSISMLEAIQHLRGVEPALVEPLINNTEVIVFCAVVLNLLIQGFSLVPLARYLKLGPEPAPGPAWPRSD